jgi:hypothetical protein
MIGFFKVNPRYLVVKSIAFLLVYRDQETKPLQVGLISIVFRLDTLWHTEKFMMCLIKSVPDFTQDGRGLQRSFFEGNAGGQSSVC